jgi:hypothetical protein
MEWLTLRVAGDVLQRSLRGLPGLQAPAKTTFRWAQIAAMLLALPAGVAVAILFLRPGEDWSALFHFIAAISIAQILPIASVAILGLYAGYAPRSREVGILLAFCLEPAAAFTVSWFHVAGTLVWTNLVVEIVCYTALGLWTWYAFHPDPADQLPGPNPTLQHWDHIARKALRHRLLPVEETTPAPQGARPQPRPND